MAYKLGTNSKRELKGVHPDLVKVVERAIQITEADFTVHDGIRTVAEQKRLVARGASQTMNSKHIKQKDGYGHAVDLVPWINGRARWEWLPIYDIAEAVRQAATELKVPIRWGGSWTLITGTTASMESIQQAYVKRKLAQGKRAFTDGPHYELRYK